MGGPCLTRMSGHHIPHSMPFSNVWRSSSPKKSCRREPVFFFAMCWNFEQQIGLTAKQRQCKQRALLHCVKTVATTREFLEKEKLISSRLSTLRVIGPMWQLILILEAIRPTEILMRC